MKKFLLVLLTFVPIPVGYLINRNIRTPVVGMLLFYVAPLAVTVFWFWLGNQYSKTNWGAVPSVLTGSATGFLSVALYLWQFLGESGETRNLALAELSQMYFTATPQYLLIRLTMPFDVFGDVSSLALQVISLVFMIAVFTAGYFWGKKHRAEKET